MALVRRLRGVLDRTTVDAAADRQDGAEEAFADVTEPVQQPPSGPGTRPQSSPGSPMEDLPLAQGHELLGPCLECGGYWTRVIVRGQKPLRCQTCKRET